MDRRSEGRVVPFLIEGSRGPLAALYYRGDSGVEERGDVLLVPPFAEEMNRCRSMVSLQARALAKLGIGTLVLDPYGTGDSGGGFVDATWDGWLEDLALGVSWLDSNGGGCRALWGVRLGALLASDLCGRLGRPRRLLFWQPVLSGKTFLTQFLRIRVAAEIEQVDGVRSTDELRRRAAAGDPIEVSGYELHPNLISAIDAASMPDPSGLTGRAVDWIEVIPSTEATASRAATSLAERYKSAGVLGSYSVVVGPPFWHVHERELAPDVVVETTRLLEQWDDAPSRAAIGEAASRPCPRVVEDGSESAHVVRCGEQELIGVLHRPAQMEPGRRGAVIVVAGGPQYRAGAHRQFVSLARTLADNGVTVLRFDLRGMGDSSGEYVGYQRSRDDIAAAISALQELQPGLAEIVLIGECESASGILFYAWTDSRIGGTVLINPWVRTIEGQAQTILKHYYIDRLRSVEFWRNIARGKWNVLASVKSMAELLGHAWKARINHRRMAGGSSLSDFDGLPLPVKTAEGMRRFRGRKLVILSGRDLIAREFDEVTSASAAWSGLLDDARVTRRDLVGADHTFSREPWKRQVASWICEWLRAW